MKAKIERGWRTLTGAVDWRFQQDAAENDVQGLWGAIGISNQITINPKRNASSVRDKIMLALDGSWFDLASINVTTRDGKVKPTGKVNSWDKRDEAASAALPAPGTTTVENDISVD